MPRAGMRRDNCPRDTPVDPKTMATLNPYTSEPERTRWNQGFVNASK